MDVVVCDSSDDVTAARMHRAGQSISAAPDVVLDSSAGQHVPRARLQAWAGCTTTLIDALAFDEQTPITNTISAVHVRELLEEAKGPAWLKHYVKLGTTISPARALYKWLEHLGARLPAYDCVDKRDFGNFLNNLTKHFADTEGSALKRKLRDVHGEHRLRMQATLDAHLDAQWRLPAAPLIAKSLTQGLQLQLLHPAAIESTIAATAPTPAVTTVASPPAADATSPSTIRSPPAIGSPHADLAVAADSAASDLPTSPQAGSSALAAAISPTVCPSSAEPSTAEPPSVRNILEKERCSHFTTLNELHAEREKVSVLNLKIAKLETENTRLREVCPHPLPCPPPRLPLCLSLYKLSIMRDHAPHPYPALPTLSHCARACAVGIGLQADPIFGTQFETSGCNGQTEGEGRRVGEEAQEQGGGA